ncbi:hypothetical protein EIP86_008746 [Pleurotus ostreatoroseus]|nr:hypothetical protein EIP86_008746 [Pleurotus ostreatoroseus]
MAPRKRKQYDEPTVVVFHDEDPLVDVETTTLVDTVSSDGRRTVRREHTIYTPAAPAPRETARARMDDPSGSMCSAEYEDICIQPTTERKGKRKNLYFTSTEQDSYLTEWTNERDFFLREMLGLEGMRGKPEVCQRCGEGKEKGKAVIRCRDCFGGPLYCSKCCVLVHERHPFHNIKRWNGQYFEKSTLQSLGLIVQLGHAPGTKCHNPSYAPADFANRMKAFMRMIREWQHLKMLKRAGRSYEEDGVAATKPGSLCLRCPACPRPGFNLPKDWKDAPRDKKYIYNMLIAIDANFRLKRRAVSSNERDPALGSGWGYFVEDAPYYEHILQYADQEDISTCTGFAAISQANKKFNKGYAVTGIGSIVCARHGFILPNATGDLQKGERYCNMDYLVLSALRALGELPPLVLSYDVICQWIIHFWQRVQEFSEDLRIDPENVNFRYAIPMYHFRAHKEKDHNKYSLHLLEGVGRSCCEGIERNWPKHEETAASTREMGPGSRHDTLEDHFQYANWRVYTSLGSLFQRQLKEAVRERATQMEVFKLFSEKVLPENRSKWLAEIAAYESDPSLPDPYYREPFGISEADIRLKLAEEDDRAIADGDTALHAVTPAAMLIDLLEIEELQRKFRQKYGRSSAATRDKTANQNAEITEKRSTIRRRIANIREIQSIYMPCVPRYAAKWAQSNLQSADFPEEFPLVLPHSLSPDDLQLCFRGIASLEECLRDGALHDALDKLRVHLHIRSRLAAGKARNVRHQGANTRARKKIDVNESKIISLAEKYRATRAAKLALAGNGDWEKAWRPLERSDVRCMVAEPNSAVNVADGGDMQVPSEGRRTVSWIWMSADSLTMDTTIESGMQDALRIEFLRSRARANRWEEQVNLLEEEKRRTLVSCELNAQEWDKRSLKISSRNDAYGQGLAAYAAEQASIQRGIAAKYRALWSNVSESVRGAETVDVEDNIAIDLGLNASEDEWDEQSDVDDD